MAFERDPRKLFPHDHLFKKFLIPLVPGFVSPNAVTAFRIALTPLVLWLLYTGQYSIGVPFFLFLAFTDALDGSLARVRKRITEWGTFYDPVADKLLVGSVVLLIVIKHINAAFAIVILALEALTILGGALRKHGGNVSSANVFGKIKMFLQVAGVTFLLIAVWMGYSLFIPLSIGTLSLAIVFAVVSLVTYGL